jgi:putative tryptophan/tyrosine transport system substrate-binding protein
MKSQRREFITLLGGAAVWPGAAWAQQPDRMRRIGWLTGTTEDNPGTRANLAALREVLAKLGWIEGRNLRFDLRFTAQDPDRIRAYAMELVSLAPDVIITGSAPATRAVQLQTQTIPIVFTAGGDPVSNGVVQNIARPEGNTTGVTNAFDSFGGKWLELLKEAAPHVKRVALVFNPEITVPGYLASIEAAAQSLGMQAIKSPFRNPLEIVRAIDAFAAEPNGCLLVVPVPPSGANLELILLLAVQHRLPAVYPFRQNVADGGLMTYAPDFPDLNRRAAAYVDRLLRGAKVSELPVQFPTKFELVINLKTAKAMGLTIPEAFLLRADEVIE